MKNANVFVDVDLTLIDANGRLLEGAIEVLLHDSCTQTPGCLHKVSARIKQN